MKLFKKKQLDEPLMEFFTDVPGVIDLVPPVPMRKAMPRWMKETPLRCPFPHNMPAVHGGPPVPTVQMKSNVPDGMTTIKACGGVLDVMRWGYMLPLWTDYEMITYPDSHESNRYSLKPAAGNFGSSGFRAEHSDKMPLKPGEYKFSPKLDSPWLVRTPPGYSTAMLPLPLADEEFTQPWRIVPGIVDTDRYHNTNVLLKWAFEGRWILEQGMPLCVLVPFKRSDAEMRMTLTQITKDEASRMKASGKGGTGTGDRLTVMPYQKDRKNRELLGMEGYE